MARQPTETPISDIVRRKYWSEAEARIVVAAWRQSGKRVAQFAREHGLKGKRISRWVAQLRKPADGPALFHPVRVIDAVSAGSNKQPIEVVLVDGRRVRVPAGFAAEDLARVLAVLEADTSC